MQDLNTGDKIVVSQIIQGKTRRRTGRARRKYTVDFVYPNFVVLNNGKYREAFINHDFESGDIVVEKVVREGQAI